PSGSSTVSLHDALPIWATAVNTNSCMWVRPAPYGAGSGRCCSRDLQSTPRRDCRTYRHIAGKSDNAAHVLGFIASRASWMNLPRSEEHTSELQSLRHLV